MSGLRHDNGRGGSYDMPLFDLDRHRRTGEQLRDEGIRKTEEVEREGWRRWALELLRDLRGQVLIAEEIRAYITEKIGPPHSPNVWGALTMRMRREGYLEPTGEYRKPKDPTSHARKTQEYVVLGAPGRPPERKRRKSRIECELEQRALAAAIRWYRNRDLYHDDAKGQALRAELATVLANLLTVVADSIPAEEGA